MGFEPGKSGNPGGRPRKSEEQLKFERQCREWASLFALDKLKRAAEHDNPTASLAATKEILDRGFGKSVETQVLDAFIAPQSGFSVEELSRKAAELLGGAAVGGASVDGRAGVDAGERASKTVQPESGAGQVHSGDSA